jgi:hypothetical protein
MMGLQAQQLLNLVQRESQLLSLADELERLNFRATEQPKAAFGSRRPFEQALPFVETDRVYG